MQRPRSARRIGSPAVTRDLAEDRQPKEVRELPMGLRRGAAWAWRILIVVAFLWVIVQWMGEVSTIVISVLISILLASMLQPFVRLLTNHTFLPRAAAAIVAIIGLTLSIVGMFILAGRQLLDSWGTISKAAIDGFGQLWTDASSYVNIDLGNWGDIEREVLDQVQKNASTVASGASTAAGMVGNLGTGFIIVIFTLFFFLSGGGTVWRWILGVIPAHARPTTHEAFRRGWKALGAYCRTQILVAAIDAFGIAIGMVVIDFVSNAMGRDAVALTPFAVPIWLIVFLFSFVPLVGAVLSGAIATLLVFVLQGWIPALVMVGIVLLVQQVESNVLQPIIMGKAVELHPLAVFLGVAAGATVAGIPGALFAIPLLAFLNALYGYLDGRDPSPELGEDAKTHAFFEEREREKREFFANRSF